MQKTRRMSLSLAAVALSAATLAQSGTGVYVPGRRIADQAITVQAWGSGTIAETDEVALEGTHSVRLSTRNFFQGGKLIFGNPIDLSQAYADKGSLLMFTIRVADAGMVIAGNEGSGAASGPSRGAGLAGAGGGGASGDDAGRGGGRAGGGRSGGGIAGGGDAGAAASSFQVAPLRNLRFVITTTDGKRSEGFLPIATSTSKEKWRRVGMPLNAIQGFDRTNKIVKEIAISGDATATIYVGEVTILSDTTPIFGEPNVRELNLALGDEREFWATASGGASVLKYTWDFDSADGIQVDAEGQVIKRRFRVPGEYTVTLTISDVFGLKQPYSTTMKVVVNP